MKANHKHDYQLSMVQYPDGSERYQLINVCKLCGFRRAVPFKMNLDRRPDGTFKWLCRAEDIRAKYGNIPIVEEGEK